MIVIVIPLKPPHCMRPTGLAERLVDLRRWGPEYYLPVLDNHLLISYSNPRCVAAGHGTGKGDLTKLSNKSRRGYWSYRNSSENCSLW